MEEKLDNAIECVTLGTAVIIGVLLAFPFAICQGVWAGVAAMWQHVGDLMVK